MPRRRCSGVLAQHKSSNSAGGSILLFPGFLRKLFEHLLKPVIGSDARFHHFVERAALRVFGRNFEITANMVSNQFFDILGIVIKSLRHERSPADER